MHYDEKYHSSLVLKVALFPALASNDTFAPSDEIIIDPNFTRSSFTHYELDWGFAPKNKFICKISFKSVKGFGQNPCHAHKNDHFFAIPRFTHFSH